MKFQKLSQDYLLDLEKTSSRLAITDKLSELFKNLDKSEIKNSVNLLLGQLAPSHGNIVFNVAEKMNLKAIAAAFNKSDAEVLKLYKKLGDQGLVAEAVSNNKNSKLQINDVYKKFLEISLFEGEGSQEEKIRNLADLYQHLDQKSLRFAARIPIGKLRLGFSDKTIIDALSVSLANDKSKSKEITKRYEVISDIALISKMALSDTKKFFSAEIKPKVGIPIIPMLAQRLKTASDMIEKMGKVAVEPKFDGLRVQIHYKKGQDTKIFTRNLNEVSQMFPEINSIGKHIKADAAIIDGEAIGMDENTQKFANFQTTMQRKRKHDIEASSQKIPIRFQLFDIMLVNTKSLMDETYPKRRAELEKLFVENTIFKIDESTITDDQSKILKLHKKYLKKGLEGIIVKKVESGYKPGRTGWRWVKMKEAEDAHAKLSDTIDAVIMGYTQGRGKRAEFGIGQFLAGVKSGNKIKTITKVGTGLSDDQFKELKKRLHKIEVTKMPKNYEVTKELLPDFWVEPKVVVELAADEITVSPPNKHTAGYALRFPRLIKFRGDKGVNQATTLSEIKKLFKLQ